MAQIRKYAFTTEFAPDGAIVRAERALKPEEVEAKCKAAYESGKADAIAEAERRSAAALEALAETARAILSRLDGESQATRTEAARVALAAARKIAGAALDAHGAEHAAAAIEAALDALRHQPRLMIRLPASAAETLQPRIESMRETHAYSGAILLRADPNLTAGQISIDWSDGVLHLSAEDAAERIGALIDAAFSTAQ
jgi:flagellar assembly protein FliH